MKIYKKLDLVVQMAMLILWIPVFIFVSEYLFHAYFIIGGFQLLSCLIHLWGDFYPVTGRKSYLRILGVLVVLGLISLVSLYFNSPLVLIYLIFLLIVSPMMAFWYTYICYKEVKLYQQKEWIQLK